MKLPAKTVERLSQYRRVLKKYQNLPDSYIFSHDLAKLLKFNPVQVRRDLMLLGISGNQRIGYKVTDLLKSIDSTLTLPKARNATIIGMGNLGKSLLNHIFSSKACPVNVVATFDIDSSITNKSILGIKCYDIIEAPRLIKENNIKIAILTLVSDDIQAIVDGLINSGIQGFINYVAGPIRVPDKIIIKEYDIRTTLEEMSYFIS
ncbi:MAG: redox-sensing transcriptional repressor Rex [Bacteroidetes bacterium 4484_249]|nr:MAG: redox-sensing transcriptional repressor Rex [Bacteroidetes bacterium 4484_249]